MGYDFSSISPSVLLDKLISPDLIFHLIKYDWANLRFSYLCSVYFRDFKELLYCPCKGGRKGRQQVASSLAIFLYLEYLAPLVQSKN